MKLIKDVVYYLLTVTIPVDIPIGGVIVFIVPSNFILTENNCYNDVVKGSLLNSAGLVCNFLPIT